MNDWLIAAIALLLGFVPCIVVIWRSPMVDAVVALNLAGILTTLELVLLAEGLGRASFYDLALVLAALTFAGGLVFYRFLGRWI